MKTAGWWLSGLLLGGAGAMTLLSLEAGRDPRVVALIQYLRLFARRKLQEELMSHESAELGLNPPTTALVLIDLQNSTMAIQTAPYPTADVVQRSALLAQKCRELGVPVVLVTVGFRADGKDRLAVPTDFVWRPAAMANPTEIAAELKPDAGDIRVMKHQWGAFYGTDLDLQLRRRGVDTILLGGIATNFGVESTARDAWERAYQVVFVEDAMTSVSAEAHQFSVSTVFPRLGRVRSSAQVLEALDSARA